VVNLPKLAENGKSLKINNKLLSNILAEVKTAQGFLLLITKNCNLYETPVIERMTDEKKKGSLNENIWKDVSIDSNFKITFTNYTPNGQEQKVLQNCLRMMTFGALSGTTIGLGLGGLSGRSLVFCFSFEVRLFSSKNPTSITSNRPVKALFIGSN
jgi:hypothetical protein